MEKMQKSEHEFPEPGQEVGRVAPGEKFARIKQMILLPEDDVSFTVAPHEAEDRGLPLMLLLIIGIAILTAVVFGIIWLGVGNNFVNITLGNHFTK